MAHIINKAFWVVFNPTAEDYAASNETSEEAEKDLEGIRVWLTKKAGSEAYDYAGVGNYTDGPITNISAIQMQPNDLDILGDSPRWKVSNFATLKQYNNKFVADQTDFKNCTLEFLQFLMIQEDATPASIVLAYAALVGVTDNLNVLDFDAAYTAANDSTPAASYTADIKTDLISMISDYIEMYPR